MFDKEFFPTPKEVIEIMLEQYKGKYHKGGINGRYADGYIIKGSILEPSAGKGDILDFICKETGRRAHKENYVCEQHPELQAILKDKDYQMVSEDFLTYECDMYYDHIIMNPPFSNGAEHLLKAIEIADDTNIVCILNAETLKNPFSQKRKELDALLDGYSRDGHCSVEYHSKAFTNAERTTDVEIAIVKVHVPARSERFTFNFNDSESPDIEIGEDFSTNEIARKDVIGNLIHIFDKAKDAYVEHMEAEAKFTHYTKNLLRTYTKFEDVTTPSGTYKDRYNYFAQKVKGEMWQTVISHLNMEKYMSSQVINNFDKFIKQQSKMAFTKDNTQAFFEMIMMNAGNILEKAILEVFDELTTYTHENRMKVEGWKTNDAYKVNRRLVAPRVVEYGAYMSAWQLKDWGDTFSAAFSRRDKYNDLDKVLCYITGKDYNNIRLMTDALQIKFKEIGKVKTGDKFDNTCESEFFEIKFYKKGTAHLRFKDKKLWEQFNIRAAAQKNWLPEGMYEEEMAKYQPKAKPQPKSEKPKEIQYIEDIPSFDDNGQGLLM